jgi:serine/threonine-protein kinase PknG
LTTCNRRLDCPGGAIDETGFCETCNRRPLPAPPPLAGAPAGLAPAGPATAGPASSGPSVATGPWWGRALVAVEEADEPEPSLLDGALVPEHRRYCENCHRPVGRSGRDIGECSHCQRAFDFQPRLHPRDVVDGRYRVQGVLGHGGFGWAYLAEEPELRRRVVLKGVINDRVAETIRREGAHLAELDSPYIVRVLGYVAEDHYLVLEYAGGDTVRPVAATAPLEPVLAAGLQILEALDHLHGKGFLHCDVKPANIVRGHDRVRLIDFGAVRRIDDRSPVLTYTEAYCPPAGDPERDSPTAGFDLYCVAVTLRELCHEHLERHTGLPGVQALQLLLDRATDSVQRRRFVSAQQFGEQLSGVIRLVVGGQQVQHRSVVFAPTADALDGGLGEVVPLDRWIDGCVADPGMVRMDGTPFGPPGTAQVSTALPAVLADPRNAGQPESADWRADWRAEWHEGKASLAAGDVVGAARAFGAVRAAVPGELVPLLALGLCAELQGDGAAAVAYYQIVSETDESLIAAHFGRARMLLAAGEWTAAMRVLGQVPGESRFERNAGIAAIRSQALAVTVGGEKSRASVDLKVRRHLQQGLDLDDLSRALLEMEFAAAEAAGKAARRSVTEPLLRRSRRRQEKALRALARFAPSERAHTALIDLANAVRPVTVWSW